ncbi:hypothetical protein Pelo_16235 [Pelomyxa schiedti]|nr:hypothetical protein Pelo_16235 [Pelomyxa schiedti]
MQPLLNFPPILDVPISPITFEVKFYSHPNLTKLVESYGYFIPQGRMIEYEDNQQPGHTEAIPGFKLFGQPPTQSSLSLILPWHETSGYCIHPQHSGQLRDLLCTTCSPEGRPGQLVCLTCRQHGEHVNHITEPLPVAVCRTKEELRQLCSKLDVRVSELNQRRKEIIQKIQINQAEAAHELTDAHGDYIKAILELYEREENETTEISSLAFQRTSTLLQEYENLSKLICDSANSASLCKKLLSIHTDDFLFVNTFLYFQTKFKDALAPTQSVILALKAKALLKREPEANHALRELRKQFTILEEEGCNLQRELNQCINQSTEELSRLKQEKAAVSEQVQRINLLNNQNLERLAAAERRCQELTAQLANSRQENTVLHESSVGFNAVSCPPCWRLSDNNHTVTNAGNSSQWWLGLANLNLQHCGVARIKFHINRTAHQKIGVGFNQSGILWNGYSTKNTSGYSCGYGGDYNCGTGCVSISFSDCFCLNGVNTTTIRVRGQPQQSSSWNSGVRCGVNEEVLLTFDSNAHTAALKVNDHDLGVVITGIADAPLFPAVSLYNSGDSVTVSFT